MRPPLPHKILFRTFIFLLSFGLLACLHGNSRRLRSVPVSNEPPSQLSFIPPLDRTILLSRFGIRKGYLHKGIDIRTSRAGGEVVRAVQSGEIVSAGPLGKYGRMVLMRHPDGYFSRYAHLRKIKVKIGQHLQQGDVLGTVGRSGNAKTNHLHFEILTPKRVPIDPYPLITDGK